VVAVLALVLGAGLLLGGRSGSPVPASDPSAGTAAVDVASLPESTTFTTVDGAPADPSPGAATDGRVVHPVKDTVVHDAPGGTPIARMPATQIGDTWLPVVGEQGDWVQVLLPSRPSSSTGWLPAADLETAVSPYVIDVHLGSKTLELMRNGQLVDRWTVGTGKASAPTPTGRTFLLGAFSDPKQKYSPVILPLGTHSPTHDTFGGGPGTVAIHTWPTDDVFGTATSDGCIRVPADALTALTSVPLGTLVRIDQA
jgi:lipoprotein-anchoring transpeptidase ErfK/SrfK